MRAVLHLATLGLCVSVAACAQGEAPGGNGEVDAPVDPRIDAAAVDAPDVDAQDLDAASIDAPSIDAPSIDAPSIDAAVAIDAATPIDAPCTPTTTQLLVNPAFDGTPTGTGWIESPTNALYPIITAATGGVAAHTAPARVWLAGLNNANDAMYQDVAVPAGTTTLILRGMFESRSGELFPTGADRAVLELTTPAGTLLETVIEMDDRTTTTAWTAFSKAFTGNYGGQTVRVRARATTNASNISAFFFDSLALDATTACP